MLATRDRQKVLGLSRQWPPGYYGLHAQCHRRWWCPANTFDYPSQTTGGEWKWSTVSEGVRTHADTNCLQADVLTIVPNQANPHQGKPEVKRCGVDCPTPTPNTTTTAGDCPTPTQGQTPEWFSRAWGVSCPWTPFLSHLLFTTKKAEIIGHYWVFIKASQMPLFSFWVLF